MNPLSQLNNAIDGASGEAAKEAAHEVKSVVLASADDMRQRIRRMGKLKGRQPDDASVFEEIGRAHV